MCLDDKNYYTHVPIPKERLECGRSTYFFIFLFHCFVFYLFIIFFKKNHKKCDRCLG